MIFSQDYVVVLGKIGKIAFFEARSADLSKFAVFGSLIGWSEQKQIFWGPDGPSEQNLTFSPNA